MSKNAVITPLLFLLLLFLFAEGYSQHRYKRNRTFYAPEWRFGPNVGFQQSNMFLKKNYNEYSHKPFFGLSGGLMTDIVFDDMIGIETGLMYIQQGTTAGIVVKRVPTNTDIRVNYIQMPLNIVPRFVQDPVTICLHFGVYGAYALNGTETTLEKNKPTTNIPFIVDTAFVVHKRFDMGMNIGISLEYENIAITGMYRFGLLNITSTPDILYNKGIFITAAYMFTTAKRY